ncbi:MAG: hypothetical protein U9R79_07065 [Armatimonadota bacterium]|nr:hypothetical protein [Armatimonadota bacterium]
MTTSAADKHLEKAWEMARQLPEFRKYELIDFIEFLTDRAAEDDVWEPDEEQLEALRAFFAGEGEPGVPLEEVERKSEELGENVLD